jgi:hypothetical protein
MDLMGLGIDHEQVEWLDDKRFRRKVKACDETCTLRSEAMRLFGYVS